MSLGKKLAAYRKLAGFTQQQLGDELNLSPQAISKWENDLAEPDLATLRTLSELYKVPIGEMIDTSIGVSEPAVEESDEVKKEFGKENNLEIIGFCKNCGITVNSETVGEMLPAILCKNCCEKRDEEKRKAKEAEERNIQMQRSLNRSKCSRKLVTSMIVAGICALVVLILMIASIINSADAALIPSAIIFTYVVFSYVACLFYDCFISDMLIEWSTKSFQFPGLIFTFDFDGIVWLIGMKILFFVLGLLLGLICALIGIVLGMICAPFVFPFVLISVHKSIKNGTECKYID